MEENQRLQPKKAPQESREKRQPDREEKASTPDLSTIVSMLEAAESAQWTGALPWEALSAVGNQAMLAALQAEDRQEGHAALVAKILTGAEIPAFAEDSPENVTQPLPAFAPVNVPPIGFSGTEPVAFAQVEQMAVDMMR